MPASEVGHCRSGPGRQRHPPTRSGGPSRTATNRGVTGARQYASRGAGRTGRIAAPGDERNRPVDKPLGGEQVEGRQAVRELLIAGKRRVHEVWVSVELDAEGNTNEVIGDIIEIAKTMRITVTQMARKRLEGQVAQVRLVGLPRPTLFSCMESRIQNVRNM